MPIFSSRRFDLIPPYGAAFAATWLLLGTASSVRGVEVAVALGLQVGVGAALWWGGRWDRRRWVGIGGVIVFLVSVALLRDGVGQTPGYGSLVLLPVMGAAARSRRAELGCALAGAAVVLLAPIVVIGGARYPSSGWRSGGLLVIIATGLGIGMLRLVAQLRSTNASYRLLADNSTDLIARFALDGTITYASPASRMLLGYEPNELVGLNISDLLHPEDGDEQDQRQAGADTLLESIPVEFRLRHRDGRWMWFEAAARAVRDLDGPVREVQAAIHQIDERRRLQQTVERQRDQATNLLTEQSALREIATLVAGGAEPKAVFHAVAEQLADLFDATLGGVVRFDAPTRVGELVGAWTHDGTDVTGEMIDLTGTTAAARVFQTGAQAQITEPSERAGRLLEDFALDGAVCAPITAEGKLWGSVGVALTPGVPVPPDAQERLTSFAALVTLAIVSAETLQALLHDASTDPITGLANYRSFHQQLDTEVYRSSRHGRALSIAILDLDHFKQVNDTHGHQTGDRVLAEVATRLTAAARKGELMARIGGEEFAWVMPEADQDGAYAAAERARRAIHDTPFDGVGSLSVSIGVCSNTQAARTAAQLVAGADQALYWSKHGGRNTTSTYTENAQQHSDPDGVRAI